jgi:LCP family protein required for cell wall assembly
MSGTKSGKVDLKENDIIINDTVKEAEETTMKGYRNIALFGVDSTTGALTKNTRSDTIMIASINQDTGDCKLVSVYRDTYLNLSNDSYNKCNAAYAKGGPEQAINMLNMNLDLNITDFVTVGFAGLTDTIDALGGVYIDVDDAEISHLNNYQLCIAEDLKRSYTPVTSTGYQLLDGLQATGYCRIRYTAGDDFKRAERQREVLSAVADQAKKASLTTLTETANSVFSEVYTSLDLSEIVELLGDIGSYNISETAGFPEESMRATGTIGSKGSCVIPTNLEENVKWLHEFLFDADDYEPSDTVKTCSEKIYEDTNGYLK